MKQNDDDNNNHNNNNNNNKTSILTSFRRSALRCQVHINTNSLINAFPNLWVNYVIRNLPC